MNQERHDPAQHLADHPHRTHEGDEQAAQPRPPLFGAPTTIPTHDGTIGW